MQLKDSLLEAIERFSKATGVSPEKILAEASLILIEECQKTNPLEITGVESKLRDAHLHEMYNLSEVSFIPIPPVYLESGASGLLDFEAHFRKSVFQSTLRLYNAEPYWPDQQEQTEEDLIKRNIDQLKTKRDRRSVLQRIAFEQQLKKIKLKEQFERHRFKHSKNSIYEK